MRFVVVGCSIHSAPLEVRERLAFAAADKPAALRQLVGSPEICEAMLLSTCNRVEIYAVGQDATVVEHSCCKLLAEQSGMNTAALCAVVYCRSDDEALRHIFRVTASLDALVVGEAQIMGQVKEAFALAREERAMGPLLGRCLERAFHVGKRVRTETDIARHPASVSSVAVDLAGRVFADLSTVAVLIVGAGEMAELAGRHLLSHGTRRLRVCNRNLENGEALARAVEGSAVPFDELEQQLEWADVVISSTSSPKPILSRDLLAQVLKRRKQRPLLIVDIAVPRDVDPAARSVDNLYLFDVDALEQVVGQNLKKRKQEAKAAEKMVASEVKAFDKWLRSQGAVPVVKQLRQRFREVAHGEAEKTAKKLRLEGKQAKVLQKLADAIVNKLLHAPTQQLKGAPEDPVARARLVEAARQLFDLTSGGEEAASSTSAGTAPNETANETAPAARVVSSGSEGAAVAKAAMSSPSRSSDSPAVKPSQS
ncbi:MAG: glutamyl-tRNA reductase [Proteobacteria bacterium]|nr:MAG: glutamyl-tRNA reductase [Pseudomonadota bacterium]PIE18069.1 MAG: glutamyl-tRNA reductase [Pseudomonadota bacterium]